MTPVSTGSRYELGSGVQLRVTRDFSSRATSPNINDGAASEAVVPRSLDLTAGGGNRSFDPKPLLLLG